MKVTYLQQHVNLPRTGEVVMCRDMEVGEKATDRGDMFRMEEDGLYFNDRLNSTMDQIMEYRREKTWCNREVTIL
jgi:hypothetical protein